METADGQMEIGRDNRGDEAEVSGRGIRADERPFITRKLNILC